MTAKADQTAVQTPASSDTLAAPTATPDVAPDTVQAPAPDTPEAAPAAAADTTDQAAPTPDIAAPVATEQAADPIPAADTVDAPAHDADAPRGNHIVRHSWRHPCDRGNRFHTLPCPDIHCL
jgi:hypothetical protein